mgnify:CR=1 FL=1
MYKLKLPIGDWSGDGHSQHTDYLIESNKPVEEVRELYFKACEKLGFTLDGNHELAPCAEYGDNRFPEETLDALLEFGVNINKELVASLKEQYEDEAGYIETEDFCDIVLELIKTQDETLSLKRITEERYPMFQFYGRDNKSRHIGYFGYGLFSN